MERHIRPIGGEFWYDNRICDNEANNLPDSEILLLNGGQSAIEFIIQNVNFENSDYVLMPSYLCPTILYKFKKKNINILFYEINKDLSINIESIKPLVEHYHVKALFFINYFGFYHTNDTLLYLKSLKEAGIILIEDSVQMLWFKRLNKFLGNYVFNSYRKFFPVDGSMVLCNKHLKFIELNDNYKNLIHEARNAKTKYIYMNIGKEEDFLRKFNEAEEWYYKRTTINMVDKESREFLANVNYPLVREQRINNYNYLFNKLKEFKEVTSLFDKSLIEDNTPLVLPITINRRDIIRKKLRKYNIFCPVHWDITHETWPEYFPNSLELSKSILSIPIDWRYNKNDIDYFLDKFYSILIE